MFNRYLSLEFTCCKDDVLKKKTLDMFWHCLYRRLRYLPNTWHFSVFLHWGDWVKAQRWSDGPKVFPDFFLLHCVVDLLLGGALEERKRKSDQGMASRTQPLSVQTLVWRSVLCYYFDCTLQDECWKIKKKQTKLQDKDGCDWSRWCKPLLISVVTALISQPKF